LAYKPSGASTVPVASSRLQIDETTYVGGSVFYGIINNSTGGAPLMIGKMYYASNKSYFIGELDASSVQPKDGTMIYSDGMIYDGEFVSGVPEGPGQMFVPSGSNVTIYTGDQFSKGSVSSGNLAAPEIVDVTYSKGFGLNITLGQDNLNDPGIFATLDKITVVGTVNGSETTLSILDSAFEMATETESTTSGGITLHNSVTLHVQDSSIAGIGNYSELVVSYDGGNGNLTDTVSLKDFMKPADIITDFKVGSDKIEITGSSLDKIEWVKSVADEADTIVKIKGTDSELFLLDNVASTTLSSSDFTFV
jgi:hypothetical protein